MKEPPYNDPNAVDALAWILGAILVAILVACVVYIANDTEVTRPWPNVDRYAPIVGEP